MSRFQLEQTDFENEIEKYDAVKLSQIDTLTADELRQVTAEDQMVQMIFQGIKHG